MIDCILYIVFINKFINLNILLYIFYFIIYIFILDYLWKKIIWFEGHLKIKNGGSKSSQDQDPFEGIT